jgi:TRAP-type C4-dicarboxylate transport system substrate-binding protein
MALDSAADSFAVMLVAAPRRRKNYLTARPHRTARCREANNTRPPEEKTMTRRASLALAALPLALVLASTGVEAQSWTMKIGSDTINDVQHEWMKRWGARVEKSSAGRIKAELYPSAQLGGSNNEIAGMQLGTIEARVGPGAFLAGIDPRFQILDAPGWFKDVEHARRTLADPKFRDTFLAVPEAKNLVGVSLFIYGPSSFVMRTPFRSIDDLKGRKVRVMGSPMQTTPIKILGAAAAPMPWAETLPALQQGVIDGVKSALPAFVSMKFHSVAKYLTLTSDQVFVSIGMVSKPWLDKLPPDLQKIIRDEGRAVEPELYTATLEAYRNAEKQWRDGGGEIIQLTAAEQEAFTKKLAPVADEVLKDQPAVKSMYDLLLATARANQ